MLLNAKVEWLDHVRSFAFDSLLGPLKALRGFLCSSHVEEYLKTSHTLSLLYLSKHIRICIIAHLAVHNFNIICGLKVIKYAGQEQQTT